MTAFGQKMSAAGSHVDIAKENFQSFLHECEPRCLNCDISRNVGENNHVADRIRVFPSVGRGHVKVQDKGSDMHGTSPPMLFQTQTFTTTRKYGMLEIPNIRCELVSRYQRRLAWFGRIGQLTSISYIQY